MEEKATEEKATEEKPRVVELPGWTILVVALAPLALLLAGAALFAWSMHDSIRSERAAYAAVQQASNALDTCRMANAEMRGRVRSFEGILIRPHSAALDAAIHEYMGSVGGGPPSEDLKKFRVWLRAAKGR